MELAGMAGIRKSERLKSATEINKIFSDKSEKVGKFPLLLLYRLSESSVSTGLQVAFSVPKKKFPKAVDRNRLKRQLRAAFDEVAQPLRSEIAPNKYLSCMVVYTGSEKLPYAVINKSITICYEALVARISEID